MIQARLSPLDAGLRPAVSLLLTRPRRLDPIRFKLFIGERFLDRVWIARFQPGPVFQRSVGSGIYPASH